MATAHREEIWVPGMPEPISHFVHVVRAGRLVFVSGCVGSDDKGHTVGGSDVVAQARMMEAATASKPDGMVVSIPDAAALKGPILAAKAAGIRPVGSLGIVVRAFHLGRIPLPEAEDALDQLYTASTLFVTRAIVELAVEQLRSPR